MQENDQQLDSGLHSQAVMDESGNSFDSRYLAAKKEIDDRALNHHVWETLRQALPRTTGSETTRILEIGAGIGTMLERIVDLQLLTGSVDYVATDSDPVQLKAARQHLSQWAKKRGHNLFWAEDYRARLSMEPADISLTLARVPAEKLADRSDFPEFHLMIAHAVLDLVDFPAVLPKLLSRLKQKGLAYLTCNFDGETLFMPELAGEQEFIEAYHASMETRLSGASHTGRRLLQFLQRPSLELLAAGSSDWLIHPRNHGYSKNETFFLHAIIATVAQELRGKTKAPDKLDTWTRSRHRQIETGKLTFLARHLDLLARRLP